MNRIYKRASLWNAARYPREYNRELSISLLREEYQEWLDAKTDVDRLDALCDIAFVAMGVIWKCDVSDEAIEETSNEVYTQLCPMLDHLECEPGFLIATLLDDYEYGDMGAVTAVTQIALSALAQIMFMELTLNQAIDALLIVCASNDTKTVAKLDSDDKGDADYKGEYFQPAEPRLQTLLNSRLN